MALSSPTRVGVAGAAVVGVAFGMARYAYGLTLPDVREELGMSELVLGLVGGATSAGYLLGLLLAEPLARVRGPKAPTTVGSACGAIGCLVVTLAPSAPVLAVGAAVGASAAGWVWAPYSDLVGRVAPERRQPRLLAVISTGTSGGLVVLGVLGVVALLGSWRLVWAATAAAAALAGLLNLRVVPWLSPRRGPGEAPSGSLRQRALLRPLGCAVVYFAACIVWFTYATDAVRSGGLPRPAGSLLYVAVGVVGLVALRAGGLTRRIGADRVAGLSVAGVGLALALLAVQSGAVLALAGSAVVFGAGYMTGAAVLAIWTAEVLPSRPGAAFTVTLVVGAASSVVAPVVVGALVPVMGLPALLLALAASAGLTGGWLLLTRPGDGARTVPDDARSTAGPHT